MPDSLLYNRTTKESAFSPFVVYTLITTVIYFLPYTKFVFPYPIVGALMLASLLLVFIRKTPWGVYWTTLCFFSVILFLLFFNSGLTAAVNETIRNLRFFLPALWGCYALRYCTKRQKQTILIGFGVLLGFLLINTFIAMQEVPTIARLLAEGAETSSEQLNQYRLKNVGGFEFSYTIGIITLCLTWFFLKSRQRKERVFALVGVVVCIVYIIQTMYATLLILTFLGILLLLFINTKSPKSKVIFALAGILSLFFLINIIGILASLFPEDSILSSKFQGIYVALTLGDATQASTRPTLIVNAFKLWLQYPIFGSGGQDVGSHSTVMGTLANNGLAGITVLVMLLRATWKTLTRALADNNAQSPLFLVVFLYILMMAFLNPIGYVFELTIAAFFIVPLWCDFVNERLSSAENN